MLDTNIVSAMMRDPAGQAARRIDAETSPVSISIVVAAELRYGAARKGSARLSAMLERVLGAIEVELLSPPVDAVYGQLRYQLEREGQRLDANDLLIAAHALILDRTLVTDDHAFGRVRGLIVENWLR
jgi:tRNA(fMet)-specific endonuclease VapC